MSDVRPEGPIPAPGVSRPVAPDVKSEYSDPPVFAALDLGTNNCRLLIAEPARHGTFRIVDAFSRIVRLGEGIASQGRIADAAIERTLEALRICAGRMKRRRVTHIRAIATEACRRATNGGDFLNRARAETGIDLEVISPAEEARLAVVGCTPLLDPDRRRALVFDIGGGSTELVLIEPEGASRRRQVPGMLFYGPPGGGKSQGAKRVTLGLLARGNQCSILDPGSNPEWVRALAHLGDRVAVLDPTRGQVSVDGLRIFRREVAVERTLDHLLPMMGVEPDAEIARQLRFLLRPDQRVAESMGALVRYLNSLQASAYKEYAELAARLDMWANIDYLRAMFDESLPIPPIAEKDAVIWLTGDLELPTTSQTEDLHLYKRQTARARAGLAIYGMIAAVTRESYTGPNRRPGKFGWFVAEEARAYFASPVGREDATELITQGRKQRYGLIGIAQHVEYFDGIPTKDLPTRVITPFKASAREEATEEFKRIGIDPDEYPEVLNLRTAEGHGYAYMIDDTGSTGLIDILQPVQPELQQAFDTRGLEDEALELTR